jgi:NADH dehydrogenase FAD-containing subunit
MSLRGPRRDGSTEPAAQAPPPDKHRVLILGGGFGGLYAAQQLRRAPVEVTLVDRRNFHLFQPLLYQVATGGLSPGDISSPIRRALRKQRNARVLLGEAIGLDADRRLVELRGGERLPYDSLVVATGARHHYFGNEDWERKAPGLKSIEDATELRSRILLAFERGEREPDPATRRALLNFVIVGAGPTGVELAGAICELARDTLRHDFRSIDPREARVLLVEGADRVLPVYPTDLSAKARKALERLGAEVRVDTLVEDLADDSVTLESNGQRERVPTGCVLWAAGVRRIVYLGGLGEEGADLSPHLRSRHDVGRTLRDSGVPVIEFRASIVIGSGSLSFEMLRALVDRLPVMVTPRLSSLWLGLVTPLYARVGRALIESICHETVVRDDRAHRDFAVEPMGVAEAIACALANEDRDFAETRWSDAISAGGREPGLLGSYGGVRRGRRLVDTRRRELDLTGAEAFAPIRRIGGSTGWYAFDWLWRVRGFLDLLAGGVGVRRGRPDPEQPRVGDTIDWWRVEAYEPERLLRLRAEMKVPGRAWLEFEVEPTARGAAIQQAAIFDPTGLSGLLYWYGIYLLHAAVFRGMLAGIARAARHSAGAGAPR